MIKKYITLAALLSAGTALANAALQDTGKDVKITTTFTSTNGQTSINSVGAQTIVSGDGFTSGADIEGLTSTQDLIGSGQAATKYSSVVPNIDVAAGDEWNLKFTYNVSSLLSQVMQKYIYSGSSHTLKIDSVDLKLGAVDQSGNFVSYPQENTYSFTLSLTPGNSTTLTRGQWDKKVTAAGTKDQLNYSKGPQENPIEFDFSSLESQLQSLTLTGKTEFNLSVKGGTGATPGSIGIQSIILNTSIVKNVPDPVTPPSPPPPVPEPSAFGLLAGLGALALVASRRRRK